MTHADFNQLLSSLKGLSPDQMRQLRQRIDSETARSTSHTEGRAQKPRARTYGKNKKPTSAGPVPAKQPMTKEEFHRHLIEIGLMSQLPDRAADFDDPDDEPVPIKGEPLSETVIRERR